MNRSAITSRMKYFFMLMTSSSVMLSCHHSDTSFSSLSPYKTNIHFQNDPLQRKSFGILYYLYYYNGGGVSTGDINNDGLPDIYFTSNNPGKNKLYLNKGNFVFEDITEKAGVAGFSDWCTGSTMADVNSDGHLDIYVSSVNHDHGLIGRNELFINNGDNTFTESAIKYGLDFSGFSTQSVFFDYDHDGDLDCFILNQSHKANENIVDTINRRKFDQYAGDRLYRNDLNTSANKFTDVSAQAGIYQSSLGYGLGLAVADFNNDGWDDLYIGNDFHENDYYYLNNSNGTFTESAGKHFNHFSRFSMGNDAADYNNDGQMDIITVDMLPNEEKILKTYGSDEQFDTYKQKIINNGFLPQASKNCLQTNNGNGDSFSDVSLISGVSATDWSWSPLFADFDNDGNKDLFISGGIVKRPVDLDYIRFVSDLYVHRALNKTDKYDNDALQKMPDGASHPYLYKGDGRLHFDDVSEQWGIGDMKGYFNGASYADLDNDGNLDLVINCINAPAVILKNNSLKKKYLSLSFKGDGLNTFGIGAKAYLFAGKKMQYQQLMLTRGFQSSTEPRLHFGINNITMVDSLLIVWPDQQYQLIKNIIPGSLQVNHKDARAGFTYESFFPEKKPLLHDITNEINCSWKHTEDPFNDFNTQYLIPHMESTRGPKLAVADLNKDGLEDFFVCGAKGNPGCLMMQTKEGKFISTDTLLFQSGQASEAVDAVFFDANNDGYPDLYVVSGGNEFADGNPALADKLFLNDTKGHFTQAVDNIPKILTNKSSVAVADIDQDGDMDIFVSGFANAKMYGYPQSSYLLINDGKGNFKEAGPSVISLKETGMVTSSSFTDINHDGWADLIIAGEWMPLKIFINNKGVFTEHDLEHSSGLWQSLFCTDINGDGYTDILAGNWGLNSKLSSGKNGPLKLYIKDFDNNKSVEQIMAYTIDKKEYTFLCKDELERSLPVLKKAYLTYSEVAGKTVDYMFYDLFKNYTELQIENLGSSVFINDGKGNFTRTTLSPEHQLSPVLAFQQVNNTNQFITGGNFFGVLPYEGRYDAASITSFNLKNENGKYICNNDKVLDVKGEIRDLKWLQSARYGRMLVVASNNSKLKFFSINGSYADSNKYVY